MRCHWIRGVAAVAIAVTTLSLATPASAAPREPVAQERDQGSLITQLWEWVGAAWATVSGPEQESPGDLDAGRLCSGPVLDRGCAIDPNG